MYKILVASFVVLASIASSQVETSNVLKRFIQDFEIIDNGEFILVRGQNLNDSEEALKSKISGILCSNSDYYVGRQVHFRLKAAFNEVAIIFRNPEGLVQFSTTERRYENAKGYFIVEIPHSDWCTEQKVELERLLSLPPSENKKYAQDSINNLGSQPRTEAQVICKSHSASTYSVTECSNDAGETIYESSCFVDDKGNVSCESTWR
jgi:hypothetical protein